MATPTIRRFADAEKISRAAAAEVVQRAEAAIAQRGRFSIALSGGSTPRRLYQLLAEPPTRDQIDWSKVECFWGDERSVPPDNHESNYLMATQALLSKVPVPKERIHRMEAERPDREAAASEYEQVMERVFGVKPPAVPRFDLMLNGMGPDGHTLSLFPGTQALHETRRWVVPNFVPKFDAWRMTMTTVVANQAACVLFLVAGPDKAAALADVLEGPRDTERLPSQLVQPASGELLWFIDAAAASRLKKS
jgi:6-phosphogluconolactonase